MLNVTILEQIKNFNAAPGQELAWLAIAEELNLSWSKINGDDLVKILSHVPNLKKLFLILCEHLNPLPETLEKLDNLEELYLNRSLISGDDLVKIKSVTRSLLILRTSMMCKIRIALRDN